MFIGLRVVWEPRSVIAYANRGNNSLYFSKFKPRTLKHCKNQGYLFKVYSVLVMTFFRCGGS